MDWPRHLLRLHRQNRQSVARFSHAFADDEFVWYVAPRCLLRGPVFLSGWLFEGRWSQCWRLHDIQITFEFMMPLVNLRARPNRI